MLVACLVSALASRGGGGGGGGGAAAAAVHGCCLRDGPALGCSSQSCCATSCSFEHALPSCSPSRACITTNPDTPAAQVENFSLTLTAGMNQPQPTFMTKVSCWTQLGALNQP
jgi:hypothetical protein